jgi:signal transduction histidine kinase/DNA-binding response OmpR family regulator
MRLASRSVALLAAALLLIGGWGVAAFLETTQVARDALNSLTVSASAAVAAIDLPLARFADLTDTFHSADLQSDRMTLTGRLLRLQGGLPSAGAIFAVSASGQLLAATSPFSARESSVVDANWFRRATAARAIPMSLSAAEGWLRDGPSVLLIKVVREPSGKPAGLLGALLRTEDLGRMLGHTRLAPGVSIELRSADGLLLEPMRELSRLMPASENQPGWGRKVVSAANQLLGIPAQLSASVPLSMLDGTVTARMNTDLALANHWPGTRAVGILGVYLLAIWMTCMALALSSRSRRQQSVAAPARFGADWQVNLDRRGCIATSYGSAPRRLRKATGKPFLGALGLTEAHGPALEIAEALEVRSQSANVELAIAEQDGQTRSYRLGIEPLPDGRYICTGRDVTNEARLAAKLDVASSTSRAAQKEAAAVTRERDWVLAALGHDVRRPMNSIMGICSLLLDGELEYEQRVWLKRIRASCDGLLVMSNGLLAITSGEPGDTGVQLYEVDVIALVQDVTDTLQPQALDKGLELKTRCDDPLRGEWLADPTRLRQVLCNLLGNAIKFTSNGHVEVRASTVADRSGMATIKLAVFDTGPGIAPEDHVHIFERFKRGRDQENAGHAGLGLGLAVCRETAALMGGTVTVESALGVGSEFTFAFPATRVSRPPAERRFAGRTALIVGKVDARVRTIAGLLDEVGLLIETAVDGYIGLALAERIEAERGTLDLVIVQAALVGMTAEVLVLRLREMPFGRQAVVVWLGDGSEDAKVDAAVPAAVDPYHVASLAQRLLAQRSPLEALEPMAPALHGSRVLVVEDDRVDQALLIAALSRRGFSVFVANDGDEAVRLTSHDRFDAILIDIRMPHRDGFEAARKIRSMSGHAATVPIVALTGLAGAVVHKRCAEAGFTAVLEKPVNFDRLGAILRRRSPGSVTTAVALPNATEASLAGDRRENFATDVSQVFLEEMVAVVGIERARACVTEFVADARARCLRLGELLPGSEASAVVRNCEELSGLALTCGATGLGEALEEIADAVTRNDRSRAEAVVERLEKVIARLGPAMVACLDDIARRWDGRGTKAVQHARST